MAASASEEYTKLRAEHPEIAPSDARLIAAVSGVIQGGMERVQGRWFLGTLPTVEKAMNELANPVITNGLKRTFIRGGITAVGENVVEGAQDLTTPILMNFANALHRDVPGVSAMDILMPWAGERADVAAGLSLMLIGSLFGIQARERRMLNSPEQRQKLLELTGFSPEQISRIEQGGTVEEKLAKAREELANRNQADISRGAKLYQAELDAANAKHFDPEQTKTLSPVLLMSKQQEDGVHRLAKPINEKYKSDDERRKDPARVLQGVVSPDGGASSRQRWKHGRELASPSSLVAWANEHELVFDPSADVLGKLQVLASGGEHLVYLDPQTRRIFKFTKPGLFGAQAEDAGAYLQRMALANRVFGDDVKFEGVITLPGEDSPRTVISQPAVEGRDATAEEQKEYLTSKGFVEHEGKFVHPTLGVTVWDTITSGNVIAKPDGTFQAIDLQVEPSTAEDLKAVRDNTGIGRETVFSKGEPSNGASNAEVTEWAFSTLKHWRKDISVKIHDSADLIPDENLRQTVLNEGGTVEGFYNPADGSIHILADRMHSQADVQRVLRHEGMHWAFANALQKEYGELLAGARAKIPDDKLKELLAKYPKASDATIVEEYLAYEGQNNPKSTVWVTFTYEAKRLLRKVFGDRVEFTDKDILAFLSKANRRLTDQKAGDRMNTSGGADGQSNGLVSFAKAQPGMLLSQVGNDFVVDDVQAKKLAFPTDRDGMVRAAATEFQSWNKTVVAADGNEIRLESPEQGSIGARVRHLIFDHENSQISAEKLEWLPNVPDTVKNAAVRLVDARSENRIYVRAYKGGTKHMVVVRPDGKIDSQKPFAGDLITQFPKGSSKQQAMKIEWVRPGERK